MNSPSLKEHRLIITDTYHLCLNAWNAGTPAICITDGNEMAHASLSDKKKEVFYFAHDAQDFLINTDSLKQNSMIKNILPRAKSSNRALVEKIAPIALNKELTTSVLNNIHQQKTSTELAFIHCLKTLIA
ncbi:MAG: hypothetical protein A6F71_07565 [Cycloclasticus sp. symbiont of Poecilosclerida sp. M]|nr:MAG: hypothetical protein A6F71_07565 [Cycloclasticus sp. symbiont of Poecilosclerida sp. M]